MPDGYDDEAREALLAKAAQAWEHDPAITPALTGSSGQGPTKPVHTSVPPE